MTERARRVLIADDDAVALLVAQVALEAAGFEVLSARDGNAALALFEQQAPDCVILDVMMPELGGFEVCRAIRAIAAGSDTPILIMTSRDDVAAVVRTADAFLGFALGALFGFCGCFLALLLLALTLDECVL